MSPQIGQTFDHPSLEKNPGAPASLIVAQSVSGFPSTKTWPRATCPAIDQILDLRQPSP
jgi:hypothetical protein